MGSCTQSARGEGPGESLEGTERDQKSFPVFSPSSLSVARWSCEKQTLKKSLPVPGSARALKFFGQDLLHEPSGRRILL